MVMPLPSHMRLPPPANPRASHASHPRSPVKKHLRDAANLPIQRHGTSPSPITIITTKTKPTTKLGSPQKLKATVASQNVDASVAFVASVDPSISTSTSGGSTTSRRLRAATLQAVLGLVDRDDDALQHLLPLLHTLASLPLEVESVRSECNAALQQIHATTAATTPTMTAKVKTAVTMPQRDSGRAKSGVSLGHCKAFLLACANEIHELEEMDPCFDYAEDTSSDSVATTTMPLPSLPTGRRGYSTAAYDYASAVDSQSSVSTVDDHDDVCADTGSQFSDLLIRTVEAEQADRAAAAADFETCRRILHAWRTRHLTVSPLKKRVETATLLRAFAALKRNRAASTLSCQRKQRAFNCMKALLTPTTPSPSLQRTTVVAVKTMTTTPASIRGAIASLLLAHGDVVLLVVLACLLELVQLQ